MPTRKLRDYLDQNGVKYRLVTHSPAYTMSEIAHTAHICGKKVAKTVMVKLDGELAMIVVPSSSRVDFEHLREVTTAREVELAKEDEFRDLFPGCETGAMPPFGNLYGLQVYMSPELTREEHIVFNAGTHAELVDMDFADYARLVRPRIPADTFAT